MKENYNLLGLRGPVIDFLIMQTLKCVEKWLKVQYLNPILSAPEANVLAVC